MGRFRELVKKYGKVALGVHLSVSAASITGLYVAVKNNIDVEGLFEKVGLGASKEKEEPTVITEDGDVGGVSKEKRNRTVELAATSGGALAVAVLLNKALFPVRVPITIALTPPLARFLRSRNLIKPY